MEDSVNWSKNTKFWVTKPLDKSMVDNPAHYTNGGVDVIEVIEDAVKCAEDPASAVLQSQVIKYIMRMWLKDNPLQDAQKAQWYLERLVSKLKANNE